MYSTTNEPTSGHPERIKFSDKCVFHEIELFKNQNVSIIQIAVSPYHSVFLDDMGIIWTCGKASCLGFEGDKDWVHVPKQIKFFVENEIKIKNIACGYEHTLAIDVNGKVYGWGMSHYGECGFRSDTAIYEPKCITELEKYEADIIKCGAYHSYVHTKCGKNILFGENDDNECIELNGSNDDGSKPHCIDQIVYDKCKFEKIVDVFVGAYNTKIVGVLK